MKLSACCSITRQQGANIRRNAHHYFGHLSACSRLNPQRHEYAKVTTAATRPSGSQPSVQPASLSKLRLTSLLANHRRRSTKGPSQFPRLTRLPTRRHPINQHRDFFLSSLSMTSTHRHGPAQQGLRSFMGLSFICHAALLGRDHENRGHHAGN